MNQPTEEKKWHVLLTMNCVPPDGHKDIPGPRSWASAGMAMGNFIELCLNNHCTPTLFLAPACLRKLQGLIRKFPENSIELGLLCHPQLSGYQSFLGAYDPDKQREIIALQCENWSQIRGERPQSARSGFFSANAYTLQALCMEGFRQSSCSLPGKVDRDHFSQWDRAPLLPHHTDPLDHQSKGSMELYEVPVTSNVFTFDNYPEESEMFTPPHLRIENPHIHENAGDIFNAVIETGSDFTPDFLPFVFITSNTVEWGGNEDPHGERLANLLSRLKKKAREHRCVISPATLDTLHTIADREWVSH